MSKFMTELKKFMMVDDEVKDVGQLVGYYEIIVQNQNGLSELIADCNVNDFELLYYKDETGGYTQGKIIIQLHEKEEDSDDEWYGYGRLINHHYVIELLYDDRPWGYCDCEPSHKGYNPEYKCCGNGCDWSAPQVSIQKVENVCYEGFDGVQRDIWELEKSWGKDEQQTKEEIERQNKLLQLKTIEEQIAALVDKKYDLINELN